MEDLEHPIIEEALKLYKSEGYNFTLDELAKELHISKKTIYKYFSGKEDIFRRFIVESFDSVHEKQQRIYSDSTLSLEDKLRMILNTRSKYEGELSIEKTDGLKEHYPALYDLVLKSYSTQWDKVENLLNEGMEKGIFKKGLNVPLVVNLFVEAMQMMHRDEILKKTNLSYRDALSEVLDIIIDGLKEQ